MTNNSFISLNLFFSFPFKTLIGSQLSPYYLKGLTLILMQDKTYNYIPKPHKSTSYYNQ